MTLEEFKKWFDAFLDGLNSCISFDGDTALKAVREKLNEVNVVTIGWDNGSAYKVGTMPLAEESAPNQVCTVCKGFGNIPHNHICNTCSGSGKIL